MGRSREGSITVEVTCLLPIIALTFVFSVWGSFYFYDKNILSACAYETAVVGSTKARMEEELTEEELRQIFEERIDGKCILFSDVVCRVQVSEEMMIVQATARRRNMQTSVIHTSPVTEPEVYIRKTRRYK